MTQQDRELLLKDLCARLPYGVKVQPSGSASPHKFVGYDKGLARIDIDQRFELENIKPYLRPMSSMTEEEEKEYDKLFTIHSQGETYCENWEWIDFMNFHHFDYRGLIEKSLAFEAPKDMYK